jgi:MSHA biogenesis protein MshP
MYPDVKPRHGDTGPAQRGFLMPLAIFILVAMGFFAITISRVTGQTAIATTQEAVSVASFYAAESGAQYAMNQLFYDAGSAISRASVDANCIAVNGDVLAFTVPGLNGCSASIACTRNTDAANTTSYYLVQSQAGCGSASVTAQRSVEISATMK